MKLSFLTIFWGRGLVYKHLWQETFAAGAVFLSSALCLSFVSFKHNIVPNNERRHGVMALPVLGLIHYYYYNSSVQLFAIIIVHLISGQLDTYFSNMQSITVSFTEIRVDCSNEKCHSV